MEFKSKICRPFSMYVFLMCTRTEIRNFDLKPASKQSVMDGVRLMYTNIISENGWKGYDENFRKGTSSAPQPHQYRHYLHEFLKGKLFWLGIKVNKFMNRTVKAQFSINRISNTTYKDLKNAIL